MKLDWLSSARWLHHSFHFLKEENIPTDPGVNIHENLSPISIKLLNKLSHLEMSLKTCLPSYVSDQPAHPLSLITDIGGHIKENKVTHGTNKTSWPQRLFRVFAGWNIIRLISTQSCPYIAPGNMEAINRFALAQSSPKLTLKVLRKHELIYVRCKPNSACI